MIALKLAQAIGCKVILSSSLDEGLRRVGERYNNPPLLTVNCAKIENWHEEVLSLDGGNGVDMVLENGGTSSLVKSVKCTKRGGVVSQVGYLGRQDEKDLEDLIPTLTDRITTLRSDSVPIEENQADSK